MATIIGIGPNSNADVAISGNIFLSDNTSVANFISGVVSDFFCSLLFDKVSNIIKAIIPNPNQIMIIMFSVFIVSFFHLFYSLYIFLYGIMVLSRAKERGL